MVQLWILGNLTKLKNLSALTGALRYVLGLGLCAQVPRSGHLACVHGQPTSVSGAALGQNVLMFILLTMPTSPSVLIRQY